jgi:uncharacterized surface protein with fasciclin (FAS1) repeats
MPCCGRLNSSYTTPLRYPSAGLPTTPTSGNNLVDVAQNTPDLSTLVAAVQAAGLTETLQRASNYTLFAPTNNAFNNLPDGLLQALLKPENKDVLVDILLYHVLDSNLKNDTAGSYRTLNGNTIRKIVTGNGVSINTPSNRVTSKLKVGNSVVYVIEQVLIPPGLDVSALL